MRKYPPNKMIPKGTLRRWWITLSPPQRKVMKKAHNKCARRWRKDIPEMT